MLNLRDFSWREYDAEGTELLEESGWIYGIGAGGEVSRNHFGWRYGTEFFGGIVDYDGHSQSGQPATSETLYYGGQLDGELMGIISFDPHAAVKGLLGLGGALWVRDIRDGSTPYGQPVYGYREFWMTADWHVGMEANWLFSNEIEAFGVLLWRFPLYARNQVDLSRFELGTVTVEPKQRVSTTAEAGLRWKMVAASLTYDTRLFDRSDTVGIGFYQPDSEAGALGFRLSLVRNL